jgi:cytochrome c5
MAMTLKLASRLALCMATAIAGVAVGQTVPTTAGTAAPQAAAGGAGDDAATGKLVETTCSGCHDLAQVTSQQKDEAGWTEIVELMISYGAPVKAEDSPRIAKYLAAHYGPPAKK